MTRPKPVSLSVAVARGLFAGWGVEGSGYPVEAIRLRVRAMRASGALGKLIEDARKEWRDGR